MVLTRRISIGPAIRKGDLVKLDPNDPKISRILDWDHDGEEKSYMASRPATPEEREAWREQKRTDIREARDRGEDTFHIAFNDGGDSRLPPKSVQIALPINGIYIVQKARCQVELGWGNPQGGMTKILNTKTGEHAYIKREMLEVIK